MNPYVIGLTVAKPPTLSVLFPSKAIDYHTDSLSDGTDNKYNKISMKHRQRFIKHLTFFCRDVHLRAFPCLSLLYALNEKRKMERPLR